MNILDQFPESPVDGVTALDGERFIDRHHRRPGQGIAEWCSFDFVKHLRRYGWRHPQHGSDFVELLLRWTVVWSGGPALVSVTGKYLLNSTLITASGEP